MFRRLGHWVARFRFLVIAAWIVSAVVLTLVAPSLDEVSSSDQRDFLPEDAPFVHAQEVQARVFPGQSAASNSIIIVDAGPGDAVRQVHLVAGRHAPGTGCLARGTGGSRKG